MSREDDWLFGRRERDEAAHEEEWTRWEAFVENSNPPIPLDAHRPDHPDHAIYSAWRDLVMAIEARHERLLMESVEAEWPPQWEEDSDG